MSGRTFATLAGVAFGGWPLLMKSVVIDPMIGAFILTTFSLVVYLPFLPACAAWTQMTGTTVMVAVICGLANGAGTIAYQNMLQSKAPVSECIFICIIVQIVFTAIGGVVFYGDPFPMRKVFGVATMVVAAYLITAN